MRTEIRTSTRDDAAEVHRLTTQLGYQTTEDGVRSRLDRFADDDDHRVLVATADGLVCGWIHVSLRTSVESGTWAEILGFVVDESARGRGIGRQLLQAASGWAAGRGVERMRVRSQVVREQAHRFYEAHGFRFVKNQRVMDLELSSR